jgi:hypothetical protein
MASIRFPASAVPLLTLCKGHGETFIFRTYADLIGFVATYGYHLVAQQQVRLSAKPVFVDTPNPVGLDIFDNRGFYSNFIMIALAHDSTRAIAEDEDLLARLIEGCVDIGAKNISAMLVEGFDLHAMVELLLTASTPGVSVLKI